MSVINVEVKVIETENAYGDIVRDIEINGLEKLKALLKRSVEDLNNGEFRDFELRVEIGD